MAIWRRVAICRREGLVVVSCGVIEAVSTTIFLLYCNELCRVGSLEHVRKAQLQCEREVDHDRSNYQT